MKPRLVLACLTTTNVVARASADFDAVIADGPADMSVAELTRAATEHQAEAILFTNTLPLDAAAVAALPGTVRVGATCSVGYDHIDVLAARARHLTVTNTPGVLDD
jgi:lactate dehydrogenase-like 2-hydroxyacid dehydrogenase